MENGTYTRQEILSQPQAWENTLKILHEHRLGLVDLKPSDNFDTIFFTGCGSTYYLAHAAAALCQHLTRMPCRAYPASELWLYPLSAYTRQKTLLVAISRSGETTETLRACEAFTSEKRGTLLTLSCYGQMPLAHMDGVNIVLPSGQERSVAQTRAFSTLFIANVAIATLWSGRDDLFTSLSKLPEVGQLMLERLIPLASSIGTDASIDRFYWLGSGPRYGLAAELSLKMKEMSLSHSEPFHFLEFRHGPKSMVTGSSLVIGLQSTLNDRHESAVLADVKTLGGRTLVMAETGGDVSFNSGLDEAIRDVLYLPMGQLVAFERSLSKGLNPDLPQNLDSVVIL
jgi:glucosamine--fructose-6-phosphate aminotransferase (isomerizing)